MLNFFVGFLDTYSAALKTENASPSIHIGSVSEVFEMVHSLCNEELVQSINGIFEFHLSGKEPGVWYLDLKNNSGIWKFCSLVVFQEPFLSSDDGDCKDNS